MQIVVGMDLIDDLRLHCLCLPSTADIPLTITITVNKNKYYTDNKINNLASM